MGRIPTSSFISEDDEGRSASETSSNSNYEFTMSPAERTSVSESTSIAFLGDVSTPKKARESNKSFRTGSKVMLESKIRSSYRKVANSTTVSVLPLIATGFCGFISLISLLIFPTDIYRFNIRYEFHRLWGSKVEDSRWVGGHREMTTFTYIMLFLTLPTMVSYLVFVSVKQSGRSTTEYPTKITKYFRKRFTILLPITLSKGEMLFVFLLVSANLVWFLSKIFLYMDDMTDPNRTMERIGLAFGFSAVFNMVFLLLPATRNCFWMSTFGIDYAHGVKYHRWIGYLVGFFILAHCVPYYISWAKQGTLSENALPCFSCDFATDGHDRWEYFFGEVALLCILIMIVTSTNFVRRKYYEVFYYSHHLFLVFLACSCLHYGSFVFWIFPSLCIYLIHKASSQCTTSSPIEVVDLQALSGGITRVKLRRSELAGGNYAAGQFIYLRIPAINGMQWHAFSISSYPEDREDDDTIDSTFTVHVKVLGGWTQSLHSLAIQAKIQKKHPLIYVDGFYGSRGASFEDYPILVLIAGGIGGTPLLSILGHMLHMLKNKPIGSMKCHKVWFFWTTRDISIFQEFEPLLNKVKAFDPDEQYFRIRLHYTGQNSRLNDEDSIDIQDGESTLVVLPESHAKKSTRPFYQMASSRTYKMSLVTAVFVLAGGAVGYLHYGYKILGENVSRRDFWALQRFAEFLVLFLASLVGYLICCADASRNTERSVNSSTTWKAQASESLVRNSTFSINSMSYEEEKDSKSFSHPVSTSRFNAEKVYNSLFKKYQYSTEVKTHGMGMWVSGPMGLIHSAKQEGEKYRGIFHVYNEEFEL